MELLKTKTNMDPVHVPYPGNPQVIQALITGQIQLALLPPGLAAPQIKAGKLKAVGVTSSAAARWCRNTPASAEQGIWASSWRSGPPRRAEVHAQADRGQAVALGASIARTPKCARSCSSKAGRRPGPRRGSCANRIKRTPPCSAA